MSNNRNLALVAAIVSSLVTVTPTRAEQTTLSVDYTIFSKTFKRLSEAFMKERPDIKIELRPAVSGSDPLVEQTLRDAISNRLADISFFGYGRIRTIVERGIPVSIGAMLKNEDLAATGLIKERISSCVVDNVAYGLPFATTSEAVFFNETLLLSAGIDKSNIPNDWNSILAVSEKVRSANLGTMGFYADYSATGNWYFISLLEASGGRLMTDNGKVGFDTPEGLNALKTLQSYGKAGMVDMTRSQAFQAFSSGSLAVLVAADAFVGDLEKQAKGRFNIIKAPFPISSPEGQLPAGGNCGVIFTRDPAKQKAAWEFLKFASGPVGQSILVEDTGFLPSNSIAIDKLAGFYKDHPYYAANPAQIRRLGGFPAFPGENSVKITNVITSHLQTVVSLKRAPEDVMPDLVRDVQQLLPN